MISLDDLDTDIHAAELAENALRRWITYQRTAAESAPIRELAEGTYAVIEAADVQLDAQERSLDVLRAAHAAALAEVTTLAGEIVSRARDDKRAHDLEERLLTLLGTYKLSSIEGLSLDPAERVFVVAALDAREAQSQAAGAFAAYINAREALLGRRAA